MSVHCHRQHYRSRPERLTSVSSARCSADAGFFPTQPTLSCLVRSPSAHPRGALKPVPRGAAPAGAF
jgi:hypothetical protein